MAQRVLREIARLEQERLAQRRRVRRFGAASGLIIAAAFTTWIVDRYFGAGGEGRRAAPVAADTRSGGASLTAAARLDAFRRLARESWLGDVAALDALLDGLKDPDARVRREVAWLVASHASGDLEGGPTARQLVGRMLAAIGRPVEATFAAGGDDWAALLAQLETLTEEDQVYGVLYFIESMTAADAAPYSGWVIEQLSHASDRVRARALRTARKVIPGAPDLPAVIATSLTAGTWDEKIAGMQAVERLQGEIAPDPYLPLIEALLADGDAYVRKWAIETLVTLGDEAAAPAIAALLQDPACLVRLGAAAALVTFGQPEHVEVIAAAAAGQSAADCPVDETAPEALSLLRRVGDPRGVTLAEQYVAAYPGGTVERLLALHALGILENSGDPAAVPAILPLLDLMDDEPLRIEAATALHRLGSPLGEPILLQYMNASDDGELRNHAILSASRTLDQGFRPPIEDLTDHPDDSTRKAAIDALEKLDSSTGGG